MTSQNKIILLTLLSQSFICIGMEKSTLELALQDIRSFGINAQVTCQTSAQRANFSFEQEYKKYQLKPALKQNVSNQNAITAPKDETIIKYFFIPYTKYESDFLLLLTGLNRKDYTSYTDHYLTQRRNILESHYIQKNTLENSQENILATLREKILKELQKSNSRKQNTNQEYDLFTHLSTRSNSQNYVSYTDECISRQKKNFLRQKKAQTKAIGSSYSTKTTDSSSTISLEDKQQLVSVKEVNFAAKFQDTQATNEELYYLASALDANINKKNGALEFCYLLKAMTADEKNTLKFNFNDLLDKLDAASKNHIKLSHFADFSIPSELHNENDYTKYIAGYVNMRYNFNNNSKSNIKINTPQTSKHSAQNNPNCSTKTTDSSSTTQLHPTQPNQPQQSTIKVQKTTIQPEQQNTTSLEKPKLVNNVQIKQLSDEPDNCNKCYESLCIATGWAVVSCIAGKIISYIV